MRGVTIEAMDATAVAASMSGLVELLKDVVDDGGSIGFLPPLDRGEARAYWGSVADALGRSARVMLVARDEAGIAGSAQLDVEARPNGRHRAEVTKVMVATRARRQGIGRALMIAIEAEARAHRRTTLVLDTRRGDPSERLYTSLGWQLAGVIPRYARSANGALDPTAFYFKLLEGPGLDGPGLAEPR
jgi:ribosomal protein S18 acetylase RimI-like enzyme